MNTQISAEMRALIDQYGMIDFLTQHLTELQEKNPDLTKLAAISPYELKDELLSILPAEGRRIIEGTPWNYTFYHELPHAPDVFCVYSRRYPALVQGHKSHSQVVLSLEFLHLQFPLIQDNANAVLELTELLKTKGELPWFSVPPVPSLDDEAWKKAIMKSLGAMVQMHPRKFPEIVRNNIHELGYDNTGVKNKDVMGILNDILSGNK